MAQRGYDIKMNGKYTNTSFDVPILLDCYGMQPLDYAMATITREKKPKDKLNKYDTKFMVMKRAELDQINKSNNLPLV